MNQVLSDPRMIDYLIQSQPQLQSMGPGVRQLMQSEEFRRTMTDPNSLRNMLEMNRMFAQMGMQVPGMPAPRSAQSFPAPGVTNTTPAHQQQPQQQQGGIPGRSPQGQPGGLGAQSPPQTLGANPFDALFFPQLGGTGQQGGQQQGGNAATNPFTSLFPPTYQSQFGAQPQTTSPGLGGQQTQPPIPLASSPFGAQSQGLTSPQPRSGTPTFAQPLQQQPSQHQQQQPPSQQTSPPPPQQQQLPFGTQPGAQPLLIPDPQQMQQMLQAWQQLQSIFTQPGATAPPAAGQPAGNPATATGFGQTTAGAYVPPLNTVAPVDNRPLEERYQVSTLTHFVYDLY